MDRVVVCKHFTPNKDREGAEFSNDWPYADRAGFDACAKLSDKSMLQPCGFETGNHSMCNIYNADRTVIAESDTEQLILVRDVTLKFSYTVEDSRGATVRSILADDEDRALEEFRTTTKGDITVADRVGPKKASYILSVVGA